MPPNLPDFAKSAQGLSRNPLGIIALFIVLVYGIAALIFGFSSKLTDDATTLLVWFLVLFPVLVVIIFYALVTRHHTKLYAPRDYPDSEGFFRVLTPVEQRERLVKTAELISQETNKARGLEVSDGTTEEIPTAVLVAEDLVFRDLEAEYKLPIRRHVAVTENYQLDGFMTDGKRQYRQIAIRFTRKANWSAMVESAVKEMQQTNRDFWPADKIDITFVVVADGLTLEEIHKEKRTVEKLLTSYAPSVDFRAYEFSELKRKYGISA